MKSPQIVPTFRYVAFFIIRKIQPHLHNTPLLCYQSVTLYTAGCLYRAFLSAIKVDSLSSVEV